MFLARLGLVTFALLALCVPALSQEAPAAPAGVAVMTLNPNPTKGGPGLSKGATLSITNRPGYYYVVGTTAPATWSVSVYPMILVVPPNGTATAGVAVYAPANAQAGTYNYSVNITDGYTTVAVTGQYVVYTPPSTPGHFAAVLDRGNVRITWTTSISTIANWGLSYTLQRDGVTLVNTANLTTLDSSMSSGPHSYRVRCTDSVGNVSGWSPTVSVVVPAQHVPHYEDASNP